MPGQIRDYRDLVAWQRAIDLAVLVDAICNRLPRHSWKLAAQMREAARSVHANIAEGNGRFSTADYLRHLAISNGSLSELESDLHVLHRTRPSPEVTAALDLTLQTRRPLAGLVKSLRKKKEGE